MKRSQSEPTELLEFSLESLVLSAIEEGVTGTGWSLISGKGR